jgi:hypothetical protein
VLRFNWDDYVESIADLLLCLSGARGLLSTLDFALVPVRLVYLFLRRSHNIPMMFFSEFTDLTSFISIPNSYTREARSAFAKTACCCC